MAYKFIFASNNKGKIEEIKSMLSPRIELRSMQEAGIVADIPEPFFTFHENAHAKALYIYEKTGADCFAEDSGLVVPALDGAPGVFSARFAGEKATDQQNNDKLIAAMKDKDDFSAYYQSVICLLYKGLPYYFEGRCQGHLILAPKGTGGFGYDPLFVPDGFSSTFAELDMSVKNSISHRGAAFRALTEYLNRL